MTFKVFHENASPAVQKKGAGYEELDRSVGGKTIIWEVCLFLIECYFIGLT